MEHLSNSYYKDSDTWVLVGEIVIDEDEFDCWDWENFHSNILPPIRPGWRRDLLDVKISDCARRMDYKLSHKRVFLAP
jgi:hypothetical protein